MGVWSLDLTTSLGSAIPKIHPSPQEVYQCEGAPICPSKASQGAKILCIYMKWLGDAVSGGWSLKHDLTTPLRLSHPIFLKYTPHLRGIRVRVHQPYAHPRHLKVLKHFVYIQYQYGCGMQIEVCSLNHDTTTSYRLGHTPFFLLFTPTCTCNMAIRMHPYAHPQHLKLLRHFAFICHGWKMQSLGVCSLNHDITTSLGLKLAMPQLS
jgi:hypothetical protein